MATQTLKNKHFNLQIGNLTSDCIILERKKGLSRKPPLYIYDLTRHCYISSLKDTSKPDVFNFDVRCKEDKNMFFSLTVFADGRVNIELVG